MAPSRAAEEAIELEPGPDVVSDDGVGHGFRALSPTPWLILSGAASRWRGRRVVITYAAGLCDPVVRPILRFVCATRTVDALLPAPSMGRGLWFGHVPTDATEIRISPQSEPGTFSFAIEDIRALSFAERLARARAAPKRSFFAMAAGWVRLRDEAELNERWVFGRAETQDFGRWAARRRRLSERGTDASTEAVLVLVRGDPGAAGALHAEALMATWESLRAQTHASWQMAVIGPTPATQAWIDAVADPRLVACADLADLSPPPGGMFGTFRAGDTLAPHALSTFAAVFTRYPDRTIVYCDEAVIEAGTARPVFKPDWSPIRQSFAPYVEHAALVRWAQVNPVALHGDPDAVIDRLLATAAPGTVGHIARVLVQTIPASPVAARPLPRRATGGGSPASAPRVGIVIPTRDRIDLLEPCLVSILERSADRAFDVLVVDNGSTQARTHAVLARLQASDARLSVLGQPGPFNYSALCNAGAAHLAERVACDALLFLNNDTGVLQPDWLDNLLDLAMRPDIGAVGALLLFPDGRVQHDGVVLGMGGVAGHFGAGRPGDAPDWLGACDVPHEVSAVTGACLMVERAKFEAVGGFDAQHLPIDLNDVDLCLRLAARGWQSVCDGRTRLVHHESASRGGAMRLQRVYGAERAYFRDTWAATIRRDPYFNANLSLYDREPRLA